MERADYPGPERRRCKRIRKQFLARLRILEKDADDHWNIVFIQNIGAGGLLFYYDKKLNEGVRLDFKINFSMMKEPIDCSGEVVRVRKEDSLVYEVGVFFRKINPSEAAFIGRAAEEFYSKKEGMIEE